MPFIPLHDTTPRYLIARPWTTWALIVVCIAMFFLQVSGGERGFVGLVYGLGVIPAVLTGGAELAEGLAAADPLVTLLSYQFLHGDFLHLAGNMLYLWVFGDNVEDAMGHLRFLVFYLLCGVLAALAQVAIDPANATPLIGASGAISGVLGAYLLLYPHARVLVAIPLGFYLHTVRIKAGWVLGLWFVMQLISSLASQGQQGGVAFGAHIGGFVAGMLLLPLFKRRDIAYFQPGR